LKKQIFTLLSLLISLSVFSQKQIVVLHPVLGDSIDKVEKVNYLLFPELGDSLFTYGQIHFKNNKFYLHAYSQTGSTLREIDSLEMKQYYLNVEKLMAYYAYKNNPDTLNDSRSVILSSMDTSALQQRIKYLSPEMRKKLSKDSRRYQSLKADAEQKGYIGVDKENYIKTSGYLEISTSKSKNRTH